MSKERAAQLIDAGIWLRLSGDLEGARKLFERALKLDPGNERAGQLLGESPAGAESRPSAVVASPFTVTSTSSVTIIEPNAPPPSPPPAQPEPPVAAKAPPLSADELDWGQATGFESPAPFTNPAQAGTAPVSEWGSTLEPPEAPSMPFASTPSTISLGGEPEPVARSTPPIFGPSSSQRAPLTVTLDGEGPPPSPLRATPPQFEAPTPARPVPPSADPNAPADEWRPSAKPLEAARGQRERPDEAPAPLGSAPDAVGVAWSWSGQEAPAPIAPPDTKSMPVPQPSPLSPNATSAWDARSNPGIKLSAIVGEAKALEMLSSDSAVRRASTPDINAEVKTLLRGARDLLDLDDHTGAMELIVKAQQLAPDDPDAKALRERSERTLLIMFESKLGKLETIPRVLLKEDEIIWLNLDHRAGFVLAQIDGTVSFDDLFAVSGMSRLDTARILAQLVDEGVINKG